MTPIARRLSRQGMAVSLGVLGAAAVLFVPGEARADEDTAIAVTGISIGAALIGADIAFTAYTAGRVGEKQEPNEAWMIAQTVIGGAQAVVLNGFQVWLAADDDDEEGIELLPFLPTVWTSTLAVFGAWSLARPGLDSVQDRMGLSLVAATNLAFTSMAIGSLADDEGQRFAPYYVSIPELALMAPQSVLTAIQAARDESGRAGWITLSVWSGVLTVHGVVALVGRAMEGDASDPPPEPLPPVLPSPPPDPVDPYYIDPGSPSPPPPPPTTPAPTPTPPPLVVPTPVPGGAGIAPGMSVIGLF